MMMARKSKCLCLMLILASLVFTMMAGCDDFDPSENTHAPARPDNVWQDGVWWIPLKLSGDNDEWFWVPQAAALAGQGVEWQENDSVDVLVSGKVWTLTKSGGGISFDGPHDPPDIGPDADTVAICVLVGGGGVICLISACAAWTMLAHEKEQRATADKELGKSKGELTQIKNEEQNWRRRLAKDQAALESLQKRVEASHAAERQAIAAEREELEQHKNALAIANRDLQVTKHEPPSDEDRRTLGRRVRDRYFLGKSTAREISVEYAMDPDLTGAIVFQWELVQRRPVPPSLTVHRGDSVIHTASGVYNGEFPYWIRGNGRRYTFIFRLYDGDRELPNPLVMEITVPLLSVWNRRGVLPSPPKKESYRLQEYRMAEETEPDPEKLKYAKAAIDEEVREMFGEAL